MSKVSDRFWRKEYKKTLKGRLSRKCSGINTTAKQRGYPSTLKTRELLRLWKGQGGRVDTCGIIIEDMKCGMCGANISTMIIGSFVADHIIPLNIGGNSTIENLQFICNKCNDIKTRIIDIDANIKPKSNNYTPTYKQMTFNF